MVAADKPGRAIRTLLALVGAVLVVAANALDMTGHPNRILLWIGWIVLLPTLIASVVASRRRTTRGK